MPALVDAGSVGSGIRKWLRSRDIRMSLARRAGALAPRVAWLARGLLDRILNCVLAL